MEQFLSLQGEGHHQGKAAYFIRLAGCDVRCPWCDVRASWDAHAHPTRPAHHMLLQTQKDLKDTRTRCVIITGGEPLMYDLHELTHLLKQAGYRTHLETSGAYPLTGSWDWICVSPKKFKKPQATVLARADEYKVVVYHPSDLEWMEQFLPYLPTNCRHFLQPEWSKRNIVLPMLINYLQRHPKWQLSLQIHNYLGLR